MKIVCNEPRGIEINVRRNSAVEEVVLRYGVNEVDDEFGAAWFALNDGSPLIADGMITKIDEPRPIEPESAPEPVAEAHEPEPAEQPEPEAPANGD